MSVSLTRWSWTRMLRDRILESMQQTYDYTVVYTPDPDGGYVATVPVLGIATQGETMDEVRAMATDAIRGYLESLEKTGEPIPTEPRESTRRVLTESVRVGM